MREAMDAIESKTCVKFVTREEQTGYITINREKVGKRFSLTLAATVFCQENVIYIF